MFLQTGWLSGTLPPSVWAQTRRGNSNVIVLSISVHAPPLKHGLTNQEREQGVQGSDPNEYMTAWPTSIEIREERFTFCNDFVL